MCLTVDLGSITVSPDVMVTRGEATAEGKIRSWCEQTSRSICLSINGYCMVRFAFACSCTLCMHDKIVSRGLHCTQQLTSSRVRYLR